MTIFMISPKKELKQNDSVSNPTEIPQKEQQTNNKTSETNKEKPLVIPEEYITPKEIDEKTLVLDGPLSQLYTEVLNQMYAKESYITELQTLKEVTKDEILKEAHGTMGNYVYVVNGPYLENDGYVGAFESICSAIDNIKHVYLAIEHDMCIGPNVASLLEHVGNMGITILHNRKAALECLSTIMKK